jgi:hypothetical protein
MTKKQTLRWNELNTKFVAGEAFAEDELKEWQSLNWDRACDIFKDWIKENE